MIRRKDREAIVRRKLTLRALQQAIRAEVCPGCPWRSGGGRRRRSEEPAACEGRCGIFLALPRLRRVAENLDPMVGSYEGSLGAAIDSIPSPLDSPLRSRRDAVIRAVKRTAEHF